VQALRDVVEHALVDAVHLELHARGAAEVELACLVVGRGGEGGDLEVAAALLDDLERLVDEPLVEEVALQQVRVRVRVRVTNLQEQIRVKFGLGLG